MKLPSLHTLLKYRNDSVIRFFCYEHNTAVEEAQQIFADLLGWLWLNAYRRAHHQKPTYLFGPLLLLDKIWHSFILHTQDYWQFCNHYFDEYFHHHVEPKGYEYVVSPEELADFLKDAFEHLGNEWVQRQFGPIYTPLAAHARTENYSSSL